MGMNAVQTHATNLKHKPALFLGGRGGFQTESYRFILCHSGRFFLVYKLFLNAWLISSRGSQCILRGQQAASKESLNK